MRQVKGSTYTSRTGKTVMVQPHTDPRDPAAQNLLHNRISMGAHKDGTHYLRAGNGADAKEIHRAAAEAGVKLEHRKDMAIHQGKRGRFHHFHTANPKDRDKVFDHIHGQGMKAEAKQTFGDHEKASAGYSKLESTREGRKIDVDEARELVPSYKKNRTIGAALIHDETSKFANKMFDDRMALPIQHDEETVLFMAGGGGSGKGTAAKRFHLEDVAHTIWDGTMAKFDSADKKIEQALKSGRRATVAFIYRPVEKAVEGMVGRAHGSGRAVPLDIMADAHKGALETVQKLREKYKDHEMVHFVVLDNSGNSLREVKQIPEGDISSFLDERAYNEGIADTVINTYNQIKEKGYEHEGTRQAVSDRIREHLDQSMQTLDARRKGGVRGAAVEHSPRQSSGNQLREDRELEEDRRQVQKAHVKGHIRVIDGKTIWVHDHESKQKGRAARLHERTTMGQHRTLGTYLRATDGEDAKEITRAAAALGISTRQNRAQAVHHGEVGRFDHVHFDAPEDAARVLGALGDVEDLPEEVTPSLLDLMEAAPAKRKPRAPKAKPAREPEPEGPDQAALTEETTPEDTRPGNYYIAAESEGKKHLVWGPYPTAQDLAYPLYLQQETPCGDPSHGHERGRWYAARSEPGVVAEANTGAWTPGPYYHKNYPMPETGAPSPDGDARMEAERKANRHFNAYMDARNDANDADQAPKKGNPAELRKEAIASFRNWRQAMDELASTFGEDVAIRHLTSNEKVEEWKSGRPHDNSKYDAPDVGNTFYAKEYAALMAAEKELDGLQPGDTMEKDGKTYILNQNSRWELSESDKTASHAAHLARQEERRDRLEGAADKAHSEAASATNRAHKISERWAGGQPIIMNHHSTKGALADRARMEGAMRRGIEAKERAQDLDAKASGVGLAGISSDDASAVDQLREKLAKLEEKQTLMKKVNAAWSKWKKDPASLDKSDLPEGAKAAIRSFTGQWSGDKPYSFELTNNNGNMARIKKRIQALEEETHRRATMDETAMEETWLLDGRPVTISEDHDENRLEVDFGRGRRLPSEQFEAMKAKGFHYNGNRSGTVFTRQLNENSRYWAKDALKSMGATPKEEDPEPEPDPDGPGGGAPEPESATPTEAQPQTYREWFAGSQVLDDEGNPRIVYHGTPVYDNGMGTGITEWNRNWTVENLKGRQPSIDNVGSWFSTNPGGDDKETGASTYAGKNGTVYPVYLAIKKPWHTTFTGLAEKAWELNGKPSLDVIGTDGKVHGWKHKASSNPEALRAWLKSEGYDGIKISHDPAREGASSEFKNQDAWIALEPDQIRTAIRPDAKPAQGPSEGDRNPEGLVFREGRWHREENPTPSDLPSVEADTGAPEVAASPALTIESQHEVASRIRKGETTPEELIAEWERFKTDRPAIQAELEGLNKAKMIERLKGTFRIDPKTKMTQKEIVKAVMRSMANAYQVQDSFSWSPFTETHEQAMDRVIQATTPEQIADNAARITKAREDRIAQSQAVKKAIEDPQTLEDFETRARYQAPELTADQRRRWEELKADAQRAASAPKDSPVQAVALGDVGMEMHETKHTKTGEPLHVVTLSQRVDRDLYTSLNERAKKLGGYYSSYRGNGAIPGFTFKSPESAKAFMATEATQIAPPPQAAEERVAEKKAAVSSKLRAMAEGMIEKADAELNRDRQTNTHKRAEQASASISAAEGQKAMAKTMLNLADAIEDGRAKHLGGLKNRIQIETLDGILDQGRRARWRAERLSYSQEQNQAGAPCTLEDVDHVEYPYPTLWADHWTREIAKMAALPGLKRAAERMGKILGTVERAVPFDTPSRIEVLAEVAEKLAKQSDPELRWARDKIKDSLTRFARLQSAGIETPEQLRAALREYLVYRTMKAGEDPIKAAERSLIGAKIPGYFPTPQALAEEVVRKANIQPGMKVLEPSAGKGSLADLAKKHGADVDVIEINPSLRTILEAKGHQLVGEDFMAFQAKPLPTINPEEIHPGVEEWRPVGGYEEHYEVSSHGDIRRLTTRKRYQAGSILTPSKRKDGYMNVVLSQDGEPKSYLVHQVVADAFLGKRPEGMHVNHRHPDGDKSRNWASNLEFVTPARNNQDQTTNRPSDYARAERNPNSILTTEQIPGIKERIATGERIQDIADAYGVTYGTIHAIKNGRSWKEQPPRYDRIILNPPFENGQDMDHVRHAYDLLKPGGRLVAITGAGAHFRSDKKATAFREWLGSLGAESEPNPEGSFKESGTGTNTYTVVIDKPAA